MKQPRPGKEVEGCRLVQAWQGAFVRPAQKLSPEDRRVLVVRRMFRFHASTSAAMRHATKTIGLKRREYVRKTDTCAHAARNCTATHEGEYFFI